jgi:hypothetical protein
MTTHTLVCSKSFTVVQFMGKDWSAADEDDRANELTSLEIEAINLVNCQPNDLLYPTGEAYLELLQQMPCVRPGGRAFLACWENQSAHPQLWKKPFTFVFFDLLILRSLLTLSHLGARSVALVLLLAWQYPFSPELIRGAR